MKILCETNGSFQLIDFGNGGDIVAAERPSVVRGSPFISARAAIGQLKVLGNVADEATDEEFAEFFKSAEDSQLAVSSFLDAYSDEPTTKVAPKSKGRGKAKVEAETEVEAEVETGE
ncbi:hypothetical protein [Mesorhizobium sp. STM 4661]|uniref:hypothetical protein n=1 Tax=Mesorhizobium sp. STM 4661 TaxID=1297570 RepID=UPI0002BEEB4F|nr:hypothetical protein [Mesorhizobium sp. STM 4661]CCV12941.1 hypothetical protein MESS4_510108 [Mesorhizobium sp. STM 4661]